MSIKQNLLIATLSTCMLSGYGDLYMKYLRRLFLLFTLSMAPLVFSEDLPWRHISHANNVVAMTSTNNMLFAATSENELWTRRRDLCDTGWWKIGHANNVVAMAAINGRLFAATSDNKLWTMEPGTAGEEESWEHIGHANGIVAMAAINGRIFAATRDNKLWVRTPVLRETNWQHIGHANNIKGMAAANGKLFAASASNLWVRDPVLREVDWRRIGHANNVVGMAALANDDEESRGPLYVATQNNKLWVRDANTFTKEYCDRCKRNAESLCESNQGLWQYGYSEGSCYRTCRNGAVYSSGVRGAESGICESFPSNSELWRCDN